MEELARDAVQRAVGEAPDVDGVEPGGVAHRERQVAAAGRPDVVAQRPARLVGDVDDRLRLDVDDVQPAVLVAEGQVLPGGRPLRRVAHRLPAAGELLRLAGAVLRDQVDLVLAARVRDVRDAAAVGRPARPLVVRAGAAGEVARRAVLDRGREHVAARHEEGPLPLRAELRVLDEVGRRDARRPHGEPVVRHRDRDGARRALVDRVDLQLAVQLVDDAAGAVVARPADVPRLAVGELRRLARGEVVAVEVERAAAVRREVDGVADPHRVPVGAPVIGHALDRVRLAVEDVELLRPAALVALPRPEVAKQRRVDDARPVGREVPGPGLRHRERHGQSPVGRRQEQPAVRQVGAVAQRPEQDRLPVRRPVVDLVVVAPARRERAAGRIVRDLPRHAPGGGNDVDLLVAVVLAGERDARAVGREPGKQLQPGMGRQPRGQPAGGRGQPQIAAVAEYHPLAMDVREAQQLRLSRRRCRQAQRNRARRQHDEGSSQHLASFDIRRGCAPNPRRPLAGTP